MGDNVWFYVLHGLAALCAIIYAFKSYGKKSRLGVFAGNAFLAAGMLNIAYIARIIVKSYFMASLCTSIYFICMDLLVVTTFQFVVEFTNYKILAPKHRKYIYLLHVGIALVDAALLIVNISHEIVLRYQYNLYSIYAIKFMYVPKPLFYFHFGFTFFMGAVIVYVLIVKVYTVPKIYSGRYRYMLTGLVIVILFSSGYISGVLKVGIDLSVLFYGFITMVIYGNIFDYTSKGMLNSTRKMVLEYMGTPMVLFDYEGYVADTNRDMRELFPILNQQNRRISMMDFMQIASFKELQSTVTDQVFEWRNSDEGGEKVYQCNFTCLQDEKGRNIGHLLIMKNLEVERDMLTQLYSKQSFHTRMNRIIEKSIYPITVVVCNTNGIGLVNDVFGWTKGNEMLRRAADLLRDNLPSTAVLARLEDGDMAAGLAEVEQEYAIRLFENIREQYRESNDTGINTDLEYGIAVIRDDSKSVEEALKEASDSMHTKKLMNETSQKSSLLDSLTQTLTESDYETEEHVERTKEMAVKLGKAINLSDTDLGRLALLAVLHDIGKIAIPHAILLKPGKLTDEEWEVMKSHTEKGYRIASASKELQPIAEYILHHHERWDGNGYPGGLKGEEIPLLSRIITVVDSHDVMVHDRPYHKAMSHEQAVEELLRCSGSQFDPQLVQVFLKVINAEA
ncbi:MAG: HD domain-containing protein [Lachnospiraceae bacterium]|nr:HD domain-containing protein [Lachnospiraceae bacterium]MBD5506074.1 HD domain-containing protein [Lachnospiraceae bacterium]